jgi:hypothetical protein
MIVASQALVSESQNPPIDNMNLIMLNMLPKMQENKEASNKRNINMLEQYQLDMEVQMEQKQKDMDMRMEQQRKDMATMHEKSVQSVMNQVPFIIHNVFSSMEGIMNVAPLQLKGPASSQPVLMLIEGNPTLQGSGSSTRIESAGVGTASLRQFDLPNPNKPSSFLHPNSAVASEPFEMDMDDVARSMDDPAAG